jgi:alpha-tubulin suppressor-like RCC1 family protein
MNQSNSSTFIANTGLWDSADGGLYHTLALDSINRLHGTGVNDVENLLTDLRLEAFDSPLTTEQIVGSLLGLDHKLSNTHNYIVSSFSIIPTVSSTMFEDVTTTRVAAPFFNKVAAGLVHSVGLAGSTMYVTGYNRQGQLGLGPNTLSTSMWTPLTGSWKDIAAGMFHTVALSSDGTMLCTGLNIDGQLGQSGFTYPTLNIMTPIRNDRVFLPNNVQPNDPPRFDKVFCGSYHTIALSAAGPAGCYNMFTVGSNLSGQIGLGGTTGTAFLSCDQSNIRWSMVATKHVHTLAVADDGKLYCAGYNTRGQLGTGDTSSRYNWTYLGVDKPWGALGIKSIATGYEHSLVIDTENHAYSVGRNQEGQLGSNEDFSEYVVTWQTLSGSFKAAYAGGAASFLIYGDYIGTIR